MTIGPGGRIRRYRVLRELGRGGEAIVHLAEDEVLGRLVALKVFPLAIGVGGDAGAARFRKEAEVLARLDHPGICRIHDAGIEDGFPFLAMSYVEGATLDAMPAVDQARAIAIAEDVARTMASAHAAGVVHGDLKPQNVLVARDGACVVLDFGLASLLDEARGDAPGRGGTLAYLAPERLSRPATSASDVYALGALLFELVTGRPPFVAQTRAALLEQLVSEDAPLCRAIAPAMSRDLEAVIAKALDRDPAKRYASMEAFARDLARLRAGDPPSVARFGPVRRALRLAKRRPAAAALIAFVGAFLLLGVTIGVVKNRALERHLERTRLATARSVAAAEAAEGHVARYARLADLRRLEDLDAHARALVPPTPAIIPELRAWMTAAQALVDRLGRHRAALESLRADASRKVAARVGPGISDASRREIASLTRRLARLEARSQHEIAKRLGEHIEKVSAAAPLVDVYEYTAASDAWHDATLAALIEGVERFAGDDPAAGTMRDVAQRITDAQRIADLASEERSAWDDAVSAIRDPKRVPAYGGLVISPQLGLVPLGQNPDTGLWEFLHVLCGEKPDILGQRQITRSTGIVLVLLPGGLAKSGARRPGPKDPAEGPHFDPLATPTESPIDEVRLDPFFVSKWEMTEDQWFRASRLRAPKVVTPRSNVSAYPVASVDWFDATRVLRRIGLSLPTEAQWEYAARGGTTTPWWTGTTAESMTRAEVHGTDVPSTVGKLAPNPFGLFDVAGNVREWCTDLFVPYMSPKLDGTGERFAFNVPDQRAHRGASYLLRSEDLRSSFRSADSPNVKLRDLGIRPVRRVDP